MPGHAAIGTTCECARQKLRCLMTEAVIAHRSRNSHEIWSTSDRVIARLTKAAFRLVRNLDQRVVGPVAPDQGEQCRCVRWMQPDTAMRSRTAEPTDIVGAVDGETIIKEDRMRHRRVVVLPRKIA